MLTFPDWRGRGDLLTTDFVSIEIEQKGVFAGAEEDLIKLGPIALICPQFYSPGLMDLQGIFLNYNTTLFCIGMSFSRAVYAVGPGNLQTSLLRRLQAQTLSNATPPRGKIHNYRKIAMTFEVTAVASSCHFPQQRLRMAEADSLFQIVSTHPTWVASMPRAFR